MISLVASDNRSQPEASSLPIGVNQHPDTHPHSGPFSGYDSFKSHYLGLSPEVADSPAFLESLIRHQAFDWLNQLVEETLGDEPVEQQRDEARDQPIRVNVPMRHRSGIQDAEAA